MSSLKGIGANEVWSPSKQGNRVSPHLCAPCMLPSSDQPRMLELEIIPRLDGFLLCMWHQHFSLLGSTILCVSGLCLAASSSVYTRWHLCLVVVVRVMCPDVPTDSCSNHQLCLLSPTKHWWGFTNLYLASLVPRPHFLYGAWSEASTYPCSQAVPTSRIWLLAVCKYKGGKLGDLVTCSYII